MSNFVKRYTGSLVAWVVIVVLSIIFLPNMSSLVAQKGQTKIPSTSQSQVAQKIQDKWGHGIGNTMDTVVVFSNGNKKISASDQQKINYTINKLKDNKSSYGIKGLTTPNDNDATRSQLISKDKTTELVQLNVTKDRSIQSVNNQLQDVVKTNGINTYVTGGDILNDDFRVSTEQGIQKTEVIAAIFILIVLIIVFRSPIVPLVSLLTVGVSFIVSLSIVMNLVKAYGFPLSNFTRVFMVVVLFGIGTDYNILLYNQFKEELSRGKDKVAAAISARKVAGKTILYSGSSVLIGFAVLALAKFSIYQSAVGVAVGVAVLLLVLLTLNPFFMATMGKGMFWPSKNFNGEGENKFWRFLSKNSVRWSIPAIILVLIATVPFIASYHNKLNYDSAVELHNNVPAKKGLLVVQDHFSKGTAEPSTIYIQSNKRLDNEKSLNELDRLTTQLSNQEGIKTIASVTQPSGMPIEQLYVNDQLDNLTGKMKTAKSGLATIQKSTSESKFDTTPLQDIGTSTQSIASSLNAIKSASSQNSSMSGQQMLSQLQRQMTAAKQPLSSQQLQIVGAALQNVNSKQQSTMSSLQTQLQGIADSTRSIGSNTKQVAEQLKATQKKLAKAAEGMKQINKGMGNANDYLKTLSESKASNTFNIPESVLKSDTFKNSMKSYLSEDKKTAKITVVLDKDPSSESAMNQIDNLQTKVQNTLSGTDLAHTKVAIGGQTASTSDTRHIASSDFIRTAVIMVIGIMLALMFITRSILQPFYILGTLLIAYVTSLSITKMISASLLGSKMLTWNTPFFTFVMLIALGVDYSIFLMMKYREFGNLDSTPSKQITHASAVIGTVVISAAIILGGTFAALMPSGVLTLIQVAIAVIIGLIILAIIIPILIPSLIKLTYDNKKQAEGKHSKN
ncbi:MMPL family transporter [Apilactobacillus apisilvae]|uniref:MMPL family transporter n=1 Tax=Apilactobacillus apisilvae TaxID=2923364 RepID=A0ABY4PFQ2_9LACO|nr:MMPL family transporter [Apilactobacillus apisilvae]UQS84475.1 MMPL family transporter [Apilactobacillus apisilvae]